MQIDARRAKRACWPKFTRRDEEAKGSAEGLFAQSNGKKILRAGHFYSARYNGVMGKRENYFARIAEYKDRFRKYPTEKLLDKQRTGYSLIKENAIAIREILEERNEIDRTATKPKNSD